MSDMTQLDEALALALKADTQRTHPPNRTGRLIG